MIVVTVGCDSVPIYTSISVVPAPLAPLLDISISSKVVTEFIVSWL
jgi:hypothetical protein